MKYNFKVNLTEDLYKIFLEDESDFDEEYFNSLKDKYDEFRIRYNDSPEAGSLIDLLNTIEGANDHFQILLLGINSNETKALCWYYVGEDYGDNDKEREQALKDFDKILKFKIN